jgi:hypothetical protein
LPFNDRGICSCFAIDNWFVEKLCFSPRAASLYCDSPLRESLAVESNPMTTTVHQITAQELLVMPDDGFRYELLKGELRKMAPASLSMAGIP